MQNKWYADNRDLVKWSILLLLAKQHKIHKIIQVAYFRESEWGKVKIDGDYFEIPKEVLSHFRDIKKIVGLSSEIKISLIDYPFKNRKKYLDVLLSATKGIKEDYILFLDPDTGLETGKPKMEHVLEKELSLIWKDLNEGSILVFYQHQFRNRKWKELRQEQFARCLHPKPDKVLVGSAHNFTKAKDVVFFIAKR